MSTPAPLYGCPVDPEAANDRPRIEPDSNDYRNPLWLIAIAGGVLFTAMAALLALG